MGKEDASLDSFEEGLIQSLSAQLVADGLVDPTGLSQREYRIAALTELKRLNDKGVEFNFIIDHKDSVLQQARVFAQDSTPDFALVFYAMWFEHWLNGMYAWQSQRVGAPEEDLLRQLRFGSMKKKMTSGWTSTFREELDASWVEVILEIADHRNAFMHYKWPVQDDMGSFSDSKAKKIAALEKAEWAVEKLKTLQHQMMYRGFPYITS